MISGKIKSSPGQNGMFSSFKPNSCWWGIVFFWLNIWISPLLYKLYTSNYSNLAHFVWLKAVWKCLNASELNMHMACLFVFFCAPFTSSLEQNCACARIFWVKKDITLHLTRLISKYSILQVQCCTRCAIKQVYCVKKGIHMAPVMWCKHQMYWFTNHALQ